MKKYFILLAALAVTLSACKGKPTDMSKEGIEEDSLLYSEDAEKRFLEETGEITTEPQNYDMEGEGEDTSTNQGYIDGDDFGSKEGHTLPDEVPAPTQDEKH